MGIPLVKGALLRLQSQCQNGRDPVPPDQLLSPMISERCKTLTGEFEAALPLMDGLPHDLELAGRFKKPARQSGERGSKTSAENYGGDGKANAVHQVERNQRSEQGSCFLADEALHTEFRPEDFEGISQVHRRRRKKKEVRISGDRGAKPLRHPPGGKHNERRRGISEDLPAGVEAARVRDDHAQRHGREPARHAVFAQIPPRDSQARGIRRYRSSASHHGIGTGPYFL